LIINKIEHISTIVEKVQKSLSNYAASIGGMSC